MEDELYRQELLERYRNAHNKRIMIKPDIKSEDSNPLCGDHIDIFLRLGKDGKIAEATFDGKGCVISMASASLLMEHLVGKTLKDAEEITREDVLDLIGLNLTPTRVKCATLALATVKKGISEKKGSSFNKGAQLATENSSERKIDSVSVVNKVNLQARRKKVKSKSPRKNQKMKKKSKK